MPRDLPPVRLRPAEERDLSTLEAWVRVPDVFEFLDFEEPPNRHEIKFEMLAGSVDVLIIEHRDRAVGFFLVYTRGARRNNAREFDIAIAEPEARKSSVATAAIEAFERWAFEEQKLSAVYANIFPANRPCLELVRTCAWPQSEVDPGGIEFRGKPTDVVYTHMKPELLAQARKKRGF